MNGTDVSAHIPEKGSVECASVHLYGLAQTLKDFGPCSETQFLAIGGWLRDFHGRAARVSGKSVQAAEMIVGKAFEIIQGFEVLLNDIMTSLGDVDRKAGRDRENLEKVQDLVSRLQHPLDDFRRIVKALQILHLTTKVENRSGGRDDVESLAEGMDHLSRMIADKTAHASMQVESLDRELAHARLRLKGHRGRQSGRILEKLEDARGNLLNLVERRREIVDAAGAMGSRSADITRQIGNVVASMQFHDITRQQIEHVRRTLERLGEDLEQGSAFLRSGDLELANDGIGEVCELQSAQLEHANDALTGAVQGIIRSLEEIAAHVTAIARKTLAIAGPANRGERSFLSEMEPAIDSIASALAEMAAMDNNSSAAMGSAVSDVLSIPGLANEFGVVGSEIRAVAANAGVLAAHAGGRGVAFGVIARAVQQLAGELLIRTGELAADFSVISSAARSLSSARDDIRDDASLRVQEILDRGKELLDCFESIKRECVALLDNMEKEALKLAEDIADVLSSITIHHECREMVTSVCDGLKGWFGGDKGMVEGIESGNPAFVDEIMSRYSMQSERRIHERKAGMIQGRIPPGRRLDSESRNTEYCEESELGANVVLF